MGSQIVFSTKGGMSDRLQTNVCSFFVSGQKRGFMRRCTRKQKKPHSRLSDIFVSSFGCLRQQRDRTNIARPIPHIFPKAFPAPQKTASLIAIFSTSQTPFSQKHELRGENRLIFIGRPASAAHFDSDILHKKSNRKNRLLF